MKTIFLRIKADGTPKVIQRDTPCLDDEKIYEVSQCKSALDAKCLYGLYLHAQSMGDEALDEMLEKDIATYSKLKQALRRVKLIYP